MHLHVSSRVAAKLLLNLVKPKLSPIAEAAAKHEPKLRRLFVESAKLAREAVPMRELENVLGLHGGTGAAEYVLGDVLKAWERELLGDGVEPAPTDWIRMRAAAGNKKDLPSVLHGALKAGANAAEVCVVDTEPFFHTTSAAKLEKILSKGLKASNAGQNFSTLAGGSKSGHVYVTSTVKEARFWGHQIPTLSRESDAIIFEIQIPKSALAKLKADEHFGEASANFQFKGNIKPEWIKRWTKMDLMNSNTPMVWRKLAAAGPKHYVPVVLDWVTE